MQRACSGLALEADRLAVALSAGSQLTGCCSAVQAPAPGDSEAKAPPSEGNGAPPKDGKEMALAAPGGGKGEEDLVDLGGEVSDDDDVWLDLERCAHEQLASEGAPASVDC